MKLIIFILGFIFGILATDTSVDRPAYCEQESMLILEMVKSDPFLQEYLLSPTIRVRTKQAIKEFNKKYPN